jgi:RHS repeat-associated protein
MGNNRRKFGTYIRDDFSKLDYAEQRYYSSALGRFITPDPFHGSVILAKPETWNRYTYVGNDPVNLTDPHGLSIYPPDPLIPVHVYITPGIGVLVDQTSNGVGRIDVVGSCPIRFYVGASAGYVYFWETIYCSWPITTNNQWEAGTIFEDTMSMGYNCNSPADYAQKLALLQTPGYIPPQNQVLDILVPVSAPYGPWYIHFKVGYVRWFTGSGMWPIAANPSNYVAASYQGFVHAANIGSIILG